MALLSKIVYDDQDSIAYTINTKTKEYTYKGRFENGKKTGFWFKHCSNGNKEYEKNYQSGKLVGKSIDYFANGKISKEANYNQNGILEGHYLNNRKVGEWYYYDKYGKFLRKVNEDE